jgi:competence protein ComEA
MPPSGLEAEVTVVEEGSSQLNSLSHDGQASSRARDDRGEETAGLVPASSVTVHVVGAVSSPGLYTFVMNSRVADAIEAAGGALIVADLSSINLARRLEDGEQIVVPKRQPRAATATSGVVVPEILDLNLATAEQLAALPGLSLEIAREIVAHRRRVSAFGSVDELLEIRGIGPRKLAGIRKRLRV